MSRDPKGNERGFNIGEDWLYRGLQRSNKGRKRLQGREEHGELGVNWCEKTDKRLLLKHVEVEVDELLQLWKQIADELIWQRL